MRLATNAMGTRFEVVLPGDDGPRLRAAGEEVLRTVREWHERLSRFEPHSQLSFINRTAFENPVRLDDEFFGLLTLCRQVWGASAGAFDPTVGSVPDRAAAAGAARPGGMQYVLLDEQRRTIRFLRDGVALDLGGVAKGFALDRAVEVLREMRVSDAILHGGTSSILALGAPEDGGGWPVAIGGARDDHVRVLLQDEHLSVSAPGGRLLRDDRGEHGHLVDPRDLSYAPLGRTAAALDGGGARAEAWSTALAVLGYRPASVPRDLTSAIHDSEHGWRIEGPRAMRFTHLQRSPCPLESR